MKRAIVTKVVFNEDEQRYYYSVSIYSTKKVENLVLTFDQLTNLK